MGIKRVQYPVRSSKDIPGECIVPVSSEDDLHEYGLYDKDGNQIDTGNFSSMERAKERVKKHYPELVGFIVRDLDEEWYISTALRYRDRIKKLRPSMNKSQIILDLSRLIYSRRPVNWYTYIPFSYKGEEWEYREDAGGDGIFKKDVQNGSKW